MINGKNYTSPLNDLRTTESGIDPELERICAFEKAICRLASSHETQVKLDFDERVPTNTALAQVLDSEYLEPPAFCYDSDFKVIDVSPIEGFSPRSARGGKNSRHGVFFGDLHFSNGINLPVAVKPSQSLDPKRPQEAAWAALKDYYNTSAAGWLGLYTLHPVGYVLDGPDRAYSFTVLEKPL